jgi:preprotein translocase subunit YajC
MHAELVATTVVLAQADGGGLAAFLPLILLVVVFYVLLIRPQQKRARKQRELVGSVEAGDRVVTIGGLHGTVKFVDEDVIHLEIAPGTTVTFAKQAVARRLVDADEGS